MRIKRIVGLAAVTAAALANSIAPASADAATVAFVGHANTSGTWAPVSPACGSTPCPSANSWFFTSSTVDVAVGTGPVSATTGTNRVSGAGTFNGWCGRSQGTGSFSAPGHSGTVTWESAGTVIVLRGSVGGHTTVVAVVNARTRPGTGNCVTGAAVTFDVAGSALVA